MERTIDPELLDRAARPGRVRGIALDLWTQAKARPHRAGPVLRRGLREARALHSRERRLVQDALYGLIREERSLALLLGTDDPLALWLGWLVRRGLPPDRASEEADGSFEAVADPGSLDRALAGRDPVEALSVRASLPASLARRLVAELGPEGAARFAEASDARAPVTLRADPRRGREEVARRLAEEGVATEPTSLAPHGLHVLERANLQALRTFREGAFEVQDEGSQLLAALVPARGAVLDLCAGAGGKSLALAAEGARVVAADVRARALQELEKRAARAGLRVETVRVGHDALPPSLSARTFDAVLVDAPCSGTGVLRRHPEHRWQLDDARLAELVARQRALLDRAAPQVAPGGRLVYGTCSVLRDEDEAVVASFLDAHPAFHLVPASERLPGVAGDTLRLAPHTHGTDGFFGAVLERSP